MTNAAERLLGLQQDEISKLAKDIIFGQLRLVVATMDIEVINSNRDKFLAAGQIHSGSAAFFVLSFIFFNPLIYLGGGR